jgi:light-regulated signal transduction histidine kinase (bacteriophytochrome)
MDGFALLRLLRADPATREIPVVLLSARAGEESLLEGIDTGADDYLVKPFSSRELVARVRTHLGMAQLRRAWARELSRTNQELEAFSYSVSHDLRTPLRAIDGFSKALQQRAACKLNEEERHFLDQIPAAAQRMAALIDALLGLARISRVPILRQQLDLGQLAHATVLPSLLAQNTARRVEIHIAPELHTDADPHLACVLLENLLSNAWKYTAANPQARVELGQQQLADGPAFFVRDNGVGFDMRYAGQLFQPFQRLHHESEFQGLGIGLATVRRIVEHHEGRIWAESTLGGGATFYFTLGGQS